MLYLDESKVGTHRCRCQCQQKGQRKNGADHSEHADSRRGRGSAEATLGMRAGLRHEMNSRGEETDWNPND